jgi:hypothetical protein
LGVGCEKKEAAVKNNELSIISTLLARVAKNTLVVSDAPRIGIER